MPKQLILLAGLHKTATTSIQQTCFANVKALSEAGFSYPVAQFQGKWESNHTRLLNTLFRHEPHKGGLQSQLTLHAPFAPGARDELRAKWESVIGNVSRTLVIAEGVSLFQPDELREMREWFEQRGWTIRLLCHVRHLSSWTNSIVAQRVTGGMRLTIPTVIEEFARQGSVVRRRIETLRQLFPEAEFFSHERAVQHPGGPAASFFDKIGFKAPASVNFVRANEGRSDCATRVLSMINERFGLLDEQGQVKAKVPDERLFAQLLQVGGQKFRLRKDEALPLLPLLQAENQWLRETLGEDFFDPRIEFKAGPWRWNPETVRQLAPAVAAMPGQVRSWVAANLPRMGIQLPLR
jgi:hypothetical protein